LETSSARNAVAGSTIALNFTPVVLTTRRRDVQIQDIKTLQKFSSVHASIHNHFDLDRHLNHREVFKQNLSDTLAK
jgi:hypothetical protein